jgi:hypothetical protein
MADLYRFRVGVRIYRSAEDEVGVSYAAGQTIQHAECQALLEAKEIRPEWVEPADGPALFSPPKNEEEE